MHIPNNVLCIVGSNGGLGRRVVEMAAENPLIRKKFGAIFALARDRPVPTWFNKYKMPIFCHSLRPQDPNSVRRFLESMKNELESVVRIQPRKVSIGYVAGVTDDLTEMVEVNTNAPERFARMARNAFPNSHIDFHYTSSILAGERANYGDFTSIGYMQSKIDGWRKIESFISEDGNASAGVYYFGGIADTNALLRVPTIGRMWNTALRMRHRDPEFWNAFQSHVRILNSEFNGSTVDCLKGFLDRRHILPSSRLLSAMRSARDADIDINSISDDLRAAALKRRERQFNGLASAIRADEPTQRAICSVLVESDALLQRNVAAEALVQGIATDFTGEKKIYSNFPLVFPEKSIAYSILRGMGEFSSGIALLCIGIDIYNSFIADPEGEANG